MCVCRDDDDDGKHTHSQREGWRGRERRRLASNWNRNNPQEVQLILLLYYYHMLRSPAILFLILLDLATLQKPPPLRLKHSTQRKMWSVSPPTSEVSIVVLHQDYWACPPSVNTPLTVTPSPTTHSVDSEREFPISSHMDTAILHCAYVCHCHSPSVASWCREGGGLLNFDTTGHHQIRAGCFNETTSSIFYIRGDMLNTQIGPCLVLS